LGGPASQVARRWAVRVTDEFFAQGDAERSMGMEVSPFSSSLLIQKSMSRKFEPASEPLHRSRLSLLYFDQA